MNFFEQGRNAMNPEGTISGDDFHDCSEECRKMTLVREKRIKLFMQMKLERCSNELGWLIRRHDCTVDNCLEENYPPMPLPIPPGYTENLERRMRKAMNGILPSTLKMLIKTYYSLPARQAPVYPQQQKISSCSPSPTPCTKPEFNEKPERV